MATIAGRGATEQSDRAERLSNDLSLEVEDARWGHARQQCSDVFEAQTCERTMLFTQPSQFALTRVVWDLGWLGVARPRKL